MNYIVINIKALFELLINVYIPSLSIELINNDEFCMKIVAEYNIFLTLLQTHTTVESIIDFVCHYIYNMSNVTRVSLTDKKTNGIAQTVSSVLHFIFKDNSEIFNAILKIKNYITIQTENCIIFKQIDYPEAKMVELLHKNVSEVYENEVQIDYQH